MHQMNVQLSIDVSTRAATFCPFSQASYLCHSFISYAFLQKCWFIVEPNTTPKMLIRKRIVLQIYLRHFKAGLSEALSGWGGHWSQCYLWSLAFACSARKKNWHFFNFKYQETLSNLLKWNSWNISNSVQTKMEHTASSLSNCLYYMIALIWIARLDKKSKHGNELHSVNFTTI